MLSLTVIHTERWHWTSRIPSPRNWTWSSAKYCYSFPV